MDWTARGRVNVDYTHGYYRELAPGLIDFALLLAGYAPPDHAHTHYLDLGFGQGLSANIHAAACGGSFWGNDFNPVHAANAQTLIDASGASGTFTDETFEQLAARADLPEFDYIVLHGIWSWVPDEARATILALIRRRLKPGGVVYVSYNAQPGWADALPLRQLMIQYAQAAGGGDQDVVGEIDDALAFANRLFEAGAGYFDANPGVKPRLDGIARLNRQHLAHDHFNPTWAPMYFSEVSARFAEADLRYTASASLLDQLDALNLQPAQIALLNEQPDGALRETLRDYMLNQIFRRDLYVRDAPRLSAQARAEALGEVRLTLTVAPESIAFDQAGGADEVALSADLYAPIIEALAAEDASPKRIGDLAAAASLAGIPPDVLLDALTVLVGSARAHPAQSPAQVEAARPHCRKLNSHLIDQARRNADVRFLASPLIGGGVRASRFEQMFLAAREDGGRHPSDWAAEVWTHLARQELSVAKAGRLLETPEENVAELTRLAGLFAERRLGLLQRLQVTD